ncbi:lasso peptide biosynthesis PqqD family chaperone [Cohnella soli]|uniref:Lasso peptide biosynthesis PqqD family chaperone n=1 Tax=Cohnella soli TaxID=425005 RepID=A0ABW0I695_9BACL
MNHISEQLLPTDRFEQCEGNIVSDMAGEKVMLSVEKGKYYNLGEVGGRIWELLSPPSTVAQVVDRLLEEYEVSRETCLAQVNAFLDHLYAEGLIQRSQPE